MRFVARSHRGITPKLTRYASTKDEAVDLAKEATIRLRASNPGKYAATLPEASSKEKSYSENFAIREAFSVTRFNCIVANPVAQVWQCHTHVGEQKVVGRRKKDGSAPEATVTGHLPGQCAILLGQEPVRDPDGRVTIFYTWTAAAERALELYEEADEEDRLSWSEGDKCVYSTLNVDVIFDPDTNGVTKPFSLYLPEYRRPVYEDRTRPIPGTELGRSKISAEVNPQAKIDEDARRRKHQQLNREPSFEERPLRFKTIWGAIEEAERREKMMKGMSV